MDRSELTMAVAGALVAAFLLGWIFRWIFGRMSAHGAPAAAHSDMASELHAAPGSRALRGSVGTGEPVAVERREGGWARVLTDTGATGWLPERALSAPIRVWASAPPKHQG